jgi:hypothetical protein
MLEPSQGDFTILSSYSIIGLISFFLPSPSIHLLDKIIVRKELMSTHFYFPWKRDTRQAQSRLSSPCKSSGVLLVIINPLWHSWKRNLGVERTY